MISKPAPSLYETLYPHLNIDADVSDPEYVAALPIPPHHATSNPKFLHEQVVNPVNKEMVEGAVREMGGASAEEVYSVIVSQVFSAICSFRTDCRWPGSLPKSYPSLKIESMFRFSLARLMTPRRWSSRPRAMSRH
jgi:hypothetical protein